MASRIPPFVLVPPLLFLGLAVAFFMGLGRGNPQELPSTLIGAPAPPVTDQVVPGYPGLGAGGLTNNEVTLVNFWASWCPPCRAEHPTLTALSAEGQRIVGINFKDTAQGAIGFLEEEGSPFTAVPFDPSGRTSFDWGVAAPPETFILAPDGTVLFKFIGPLIGSDYRQRFLPELEKARAAAGGSAAASTGGS